MNLKKIARDTGCCCSGCQRKSDRVIELIIDQISNLKWQDEDSYHPRSHHHGYLKAVREMKKLFGIESWMDECDCNMCTIKSYDV